ncbi:retrovirus-related Pol polyprotein from transposon TNT 1-94 [Trichonephila clavata]|uniref:Retrovirus-related Pol polyprotein from transposon TNT 1-94 n=1 Tax=Trichonephila clavata TaxID=2740835 RepID=A0A8X6ITF0_TRICU|nr:retrovirus-related Pol polyprotein from transposon TNT 1-94 [Trichonephila clavata]
MANYSIPKLEGQNYVSWANDVKYLLMERQVWNIVDEKEIEPKLDASTDAEAVKEVKNFKARKQIAMSIIYLNIDSSHRRIVERIDDPVEAWKVLKTYYQPDSKAPPHGDKDFSERYVTFQLLRYLPPQFDSRVQTILRLDDVKFVYKDVVAELVAEEARLKLRNIDMNKEIAAQSTRMESKKRSIKTCYQCKSPDHLKKNCPELTSRRTTMNNSYRSPRRHFTPRNVKGSYQHGKRCQSHLPDRDNLGTTTDVATRLLINVITSTTEAGAVLEPVYLKFEPFEPFPDEDSRHERIVKDASDKSSVATPESSEDETDEDSSDTHKPSTKTVNWFRKLVPRPDGSRTDVYYYQEGCTKRLRTLKNIEKYCKDHNKTFD